VHSVRIMKDRATRRPRGFAFVEMESRGAAKAIKGLDGLEYMGRNLRVNEGAERKEQGNEAA
jgi:RNA recognition motif-containing protein